MVLINQNLVIFVPLTKLKTPPSQSHQLPTPVRIDRLQFFLRGYDPELVQQIISGFQQGFSLHFEGTQVSCTFKNLLSADQNPSAVEDKLNKEVALGRLAGPFTQPPFSNFCISPLGVVPKKTPGEYRLIHHLSFPKGSSINDNISDEFTSVSYANIQDAIRNIKLAGRGCHLAKTDIKNAFRIIPISPKDYHLLGMVWKDLYYFDKCMPMGCSSSCKTFELLSTALEWVAHHHLHINYIIHLLDDFLIVAPSFELCQSQLSLFTSFCDFVGVPIAPEKTCGPSTVLSFAGIELDTILFEARLPQEKIEKWLVFLM